MRIYTVAELSGEPSQAIHSQPSHQLLIPLPAVTVINTSISLLLNCVSNISFNFLHEFRNLLSTINLFNKAYIFIYQIAKNQKRWY